MKIQVIDNVASESSVDDIASCLAKNYRIGQG